MFKPLLCALTVFTTPVWAEPPRVVTDIAPVHGLVARVMQGVGTPDLLIAPGASPHDYALRPSNASALEQAELVVWIGPDLSPGLAKPMATLAGSARHITLLDRPETEVLERREGTNLMDADHDHDHGHDHDDHAHDPHAWLSPGNGQAWLGIIGDALAQADPDNAATYRANAATGQAEIDTVVHDITAQLAPFADTPYVVFHDAYQYFETAFGLTPAGAISLSDASDPSPARIADIRAIVARTGATCVFAEPQFNAGVVATVFDGSAARTGLLDPLGTTIPTGQAFYPTLLGAMAQAMADCL
ncbi:zinc ABC transporter substrate-binding protein [Oceaniglobus ichthyenteri]|uniref:zinc ABC transporter substrate-binding protein n=1 Tax=Oceaniglobus ichthyenteri TaxID=2136177 RepID=UPI000D345734|nr:zinc ABC transporter substrate-binding protein [Oceaniglobus ichthyenteri]